MPHGSVIFWHIPIPAWENTDHETFVCAPWDGWSGDFRGKSGESGENLKMLCQVERKKEAAANDLLRGSRKKSTPSIIRGAIVFSGKRLQASSIFIFSGSHTHIHTRADHSTPQHPKIIMHSRNKIYPKLRILTKCFSESLMAQFRRAVLLSYSIQYSLYVVHLQRHFILKAK